MAKGVIRKKKELLILKDIIDINNSKVIFFSDSFFLFWMEVYRPKLMAMVRIKTEKLLNIVYRYPPFVRVSQQHIAVV